MSIPVHCEHCDRRFAIADEWDGRCIKCPTCKSPISVSSEPDIYDLADDSALGFDTDTRTRPHDKPTPGQSQYPRHGAQPHRSASPRQSPPVPPETAERPATLEFSEESDDNRAIPVAEAVQPAARPDPPPGHSQEKATLFDKQWPTVTFHFDLNVMEALQNSKRFLAVLTIMGFGVMFSLCAGSPITAIAVVACGTIPACVAVLPDTFENDNRIGVCMIWIACFGGCTNVFTALHGLVNGQCELEQRVFSASCIIAGTAVSLTVLYNLIRMFGPFIALTVGYISWVCILLGAAVVG